MNKLFLIKNPKVFQGEKYLKSNKNYFEGWYFKNTNNTNTVAFIPGINITNNEKKAFIQVITNNDSYFINYDINEFKFSLEPFYIKIGKNFFSSNNIHIDIKDYNLKIYGDIKYSNIEKIKTHTLSPNIMGPFSYIPFMECNHAIININSQANGKITINNNEIIFNNGSGYIEKDWGSSFPKSYIWCQSNDFENPNTSFMLSIANIPFKAFSFEGFICVLVIDNHEYRFTTYNGSKLIKYEITPNFINVILKKKHYYLEIKSNYPQGLKLLAPTKGKMNKDVFESVSALIKVTLKKDNKIIFTDTSKNSGLEIVQE